jgi:dihydroxyacetone kinase
MLAVTVINWQVNAAFTDTYATLHDTTEAHSHATAASATATRSKTDTTRPLANHANHN